jgi:hypothetical protein
MAEHEVLDVCFYAPHAACAQSIHDTQPLLGTVQKLLKDGWPAWIRAEDDVFWPQCGSFSISVIKVSLCITLLSRPSDRSPLCNGFDQSVRRPLYTCKLIRAEQGLPAVCNTLTPLRYLIRPRLPTPRDPAPDALHALCQLRCAPGLRACLRRRARTACQQSAADPLHDRAGNHPAEHVAQRIAAKTQRVAEPQRCAVAVGVGVDPARETDRVALHVAADGRIVIAEVVVIQPGRGVVTLAGEGMCCRPASLLSGFLRLSPLYCRF